MKPRAKCYCSINDKLWTKDRINNYIKECSEYAKMVYDKAQEIEDEVEKRKFLSKGLTSLHSLKELGYTNVETARNELSNKIPFKTKQCGYAMKCCGECVTPCKNRCVQDVLNRYYNMCISTYMGYQNTAPIQLQQLLNPKVQYDELVDTINSIINSSQVIENYEDNPYLLNYEPSPEYYCTRTGKYQKKIDTVTGAIKFVEWPNSGLCPYCMPPVTAYSQNDNRVKDGKKYTRQKDEITKCIGKK